MKIVIFKVTVSTQKKRTELNRFQILVTVIGSHSGIG